MLNRIILTALAVFFAVVQASSAYVGLVDQSYGPNNNVAGVGRFVEQAGGPAVALWDIRSTVETTDFDNAALQGGSDGIQYVMQNAVNNSVDTNIVTFRVSPFDQAIPTISIAQSPYNDVNGWNGGNLPGDVAQFRMTWQGGGFATISDPSNQLEGLGHNTSVESGTWVKFTDFQRLNSDDVWGITLPQGVDVVTLNWNSSNPLEGSDLTNEWVTFDANFTPGVTILPEPNSAVMLLICFGFAAGRLRRRRR